MEMSGVAAHLLFNLMGEECEKLLKYLKILDKYVTRAQEMFVVSGILVAIFLVFTQVITRYIMGRSYGWIDETAQYLMLWIAFIGCILCVRSREHVGVDVVFKFIPKRYIKQYTGVLFLIAGVFMIYFSYAAYLLVSNVQRTGQASVAMPWFPYWIVYLAAPIGAILMSMEFFRGGFKMLLVESKIANSQEMERE